MYRNMICGRVIHVKKTLFRQQILKTLRQFEAVVEVSLHRSITKYSNKVAIKTIVCDLWQIKKETYRENPKRKPQNL